MKFHQLLLSALVLSFFVNACNQAEVPGEFPAAINTTAAATQTATATSTPTPTPYPPAEPISVSNAGEITEVLSIGRGSFQGIILSPDKTEVLIATSLGFYICDAQTLEVKDFIKIDGARNVAWSPDGQRLAFEVSTDEFQRELYIYDLGSKEFSSIYKPQRGWELGGFSWNNDSSAIGFRAEDWNRVGQTSLIIVELEDGLVKLNAPISGWVDSLAWAPDGQRFAVSMESNRNITSEVSSVIQIWDPNKVKPILSFPTPAQGILEWSSDGSKISLQTREGWFYIYEAATGDELLQVDTGTKPGKIDYSAGYNLQEWTNSDENIQFLNPKGDLWQINIVNGAFERLTDRGLAENVFGLSLGSPVVYAKENSFSLDHIDSSTGEINWTEILGGNLKAINVETGDVVGRFTGLSVAATQANLMRDEQMLCTKKDYFDYDEKAVGNVIRFWDLTTGDEISRDDGENCGISSGDIEAEQPDWSGPAGPATKTVDMGTYTSTSFSVFSEGETWLSPDGKTKLEIGPNGSILVKNIDTNEVRQTLKGTGFGISLLAGSPNGEYVTAVSKDWTMKIWNLGDGEELATLGSIDRQFPIEWSPDSKKILFINRSYQNQVGVFDISTGDRIDLAIQHLDPDGLDALKLFSWSAGGDMILGATAYGVELFDATTGEVLKHLSNDVVDWYSPRDDFRMGWLENGAWIFVSHYNGTVSLWGLEQP